MKLKLADIKHYLCRINHLAYHPRQHLVHWVQDLSFRKLLQNAGWLLSGNGITTVLALLATALKTHTLGVEQFGLLSVILAYVTLIEQFATFRPWQALIKFGAAALKEERYDDLLGHIKLSLLLDGFGAITGTVIAIAGSYYLAFWQGWNLEMSRLTALFSISLLFNLSGTPTGILRLLDRFDLQAKRNILTNLLALAGAFLVYLYGGGIWGFVTVMLVSSIFGSLLLLFMALIALRQRNLPGNWYASVKEWKPFLRFTMWTYIASTVDIPVKQLDVIIVSTVISLEAAGIYKIIKQVTQILGMLADPIYQAVYPQFATMIANHDSRRAVEYALRIGFLLLVVTGLPTTLLATTSFWWLRVVFGQGFSSGAIPLIAFLVVQVFNFACNPVHPLFTAMGYIKQTTIMVIITNLLYLLLAWQLGLRIGLLGLAVASAVEFITRVLLKVFYIRSREYQQIKPVTQSA